MIGSATRAGDYRKPELSGLAMKGALAYMEERLGAREVDGFLEERGITREYLKDQNNWVALSFGHECLQALRDRIDPETACWEAGLHTVRPESLGRVVWITLKSVGTPSLVFKQWVQYSKMYNRVGFFDIREVKRNRLVLEYRPSETFRETDRLFCQYRMGQFSAIPTIWGLPLADCKHIACMADGADACTYEFTWQQRRSFLYPLAGLALGAAGALAYNRLLLPGQDLSLWLVTILFLVSGVTAGSMLGFRRVVACNEEIGRERQEALEASLGTVSDKYVELQESTRALEEAHRELTLHKDHLEELVGERTRELERSKTELEASYEKLQDLDRMKMRFFNNVSHELRTPLTLTLSPVEAMLQGEMGPLGAEQREYLQSVHTNAMRLLKLINNLLDLAKLEDGRVELAYGRYELPAFLREVVRPFSVSGKKRGVEVRVEGDEGLPPVCFDKERVEKVLINLVGNAVKYMPAGGCVEVGWAVEGEAVRVSVRDTGPGIPEEALERIFNRFEQVDQSSSRKFGGTGIGLSLAKEIVELHGGRIVAANHPEGGAVFSFTLPLAERDVQASEPEGEAEEGWVKSMFQKADYVEDADKHAANSGEPEPPAPEAAEGEEAAGRSGEKPLVLLVEDNPDMRRFTAHSLQKAFRVETAVDGRDGWDQVRALVPDLVVSDIMMPNWNGYELCAAVKNDPELRHVPLLLLSSKSEVEMKVEGFEQGADDYLTKPYNPRELLARARSLIRMRALEREVQQRNRELQQALRELQDAQIQLVHSEKMASLGVLSAGLVHEVNNPLNAAISSIRTLSRSLEQVQAGQGITPTQHEKMSRTSLRALQGLKRCEEIITGLRRFSRKDLEGKREEDIHEGLDSTLSLLPQELRGRITFHRDYRLAEKVPCHLGQLNQVFMNLLVNACQACGPSGDVWLRTALRDGRAEITVEDNGSGIPQEHLPRIFEPFFTTKDVGQGTGLGLSISHKIIEEHRGRIHVESTPGRGTLFRIQLPVRPAEASPAQENRDGRIRHAVGL